MSPVMAQAPLRRRETRVRRQKYSAKLNDERDSFPARLNWDYCIGVDSRPGVGERRFVERRSSLPARLPA